MNYNKKTMRVYFLVLCLSYFFTLSAQELQHTNGYTLQQSQKGKFYFNQSAHWNPLSKKLQVPVDTINDMEWNPIIFLPPDTTHTRVVIGWPDIAANTTSEGEFFHIVYPNNSLLYYGRTNDGLNYNMKIISDSSVLEIAYANIVAFDSTVLLFCFAYINGFAVSPVYLMRSTNNGETFDTARQISKEVFACTAQTTFYPVVRGDTVLYFISGGKKDGRYWHISTDRGVTWRVMKKNTPYPGAKYLYSKLQAAMTSRGLHLAYTKLGKKKREGETYFSTSINLGKSWKKKRALSQLDGYSSDVARIVSSDNDNLHAVWEDGRLGSVDGFSLSISYRRSSDAGKTWTDEQVLTQRPEAIFENSKGIAIEKTEGNVLAVGWLYGLMDDSTRNKIRVSMDGGLSWMPERIVNPFTLKANECAVSATKNMVAEMWPELHYNNGYKYFPYIRAAKLVRKTERTQPAVTIKIPEVTQLNNYPNPFNPNTTFQFNLAATSKVTLKIYNTLSEEISTLISNSELERGTHAIDFKAINLASGVYFAHLSVETMWGDKYRDVKKIMLVK
ncbi:MAG: sialidase family protein [Bacteroidota bacterium]